ncbi:hypothetical protein D3C85_1496760 [compost metagenome]
MARSHLVDFIRQAQRLTRHLHDAIGHGLEYLADQPDAAGRGLHGARHQPQFTDVALALFGLEHEALVRAKAELRGTRDGHPAVAGGREGDVARRLDAA